MCCTGTAVQVALVQKLISSIERKLDVITNELINL